MLVEAKVENASQAHAAVLSTDGVAKPLAVPSRPNGAGFAMNGGEFLCMALATCYCNDIYREAAKRKITIERVEVEVIGDFGVEGEPAQNISYRAQVHAKGNEAEIRELMDYTDTVAEIQNTLRAGIPVKLTNVEVVNN